MSLITLNDTRLNDIRQQNYSTSFKSNISIDFLKEIFQKKVNGKLTGIAQVFNQLLFRDNNKWPMTISQQAIATPSRLTRLHTGELLRQLEEIGLIQVIRIRKQKNTYIIHPMFYQKHIRSALSKRLPELNDEKVSKRRYYGDLICASKNAQNWLYKSDISEAYKNQKSITIYNDISYTENTGLLECDDGAILQPYIPFDFESEPVVTGWENKTTREETGLTSYSFNQLLKNKPVIQPIKQKIFKKKEITAMQVDLYESVFIPVTKNLKSIRVTVWGQIRLSCYPEEALLYADEQMLKLGKPVTNRFKYFCGIADVFCKTNQLPVDWSGMFRLARENGMPDDGPFIDISFIPVKPVKQTSYSKTTSKVTDRDRARENEENLKREGQEGCVRQQQKFATEWEEIRINQPERFARLEANAKEFRRILGLNEDGTFKPGHTPQQAVDILTKIL